MNLSEKIFWAKRNIEKSNAAEGGKAQKKLLIFTKSGVFRPPHRTGRFVFWGGGPFQPANPAFLKPTACYKKLYFSTNISKPFYKYSLSKNILFCNTFFLHFPTESHLQKSTPFYNSPAGNLRSRFERGRNMVIPPGEAPAANWRLRRRGGAWRHGQTTGNRGTQSHGG